MIYKFVILLNLISIIINVSGIPDVCSDSFRINAAFFWPLNGEILYLVSGDYYWAFKMDTIKLEKYFDGKLSERFQDVHKPIATISISKTGAYNLEENQGLIVFFHAAADERLEHQVYKFTNEYKPTQMKPVLKGLTDPKYYRMDKLTLTAATTGGFDSIFLIYQKFSQLCKYTISSGQVSNTTNSRSKLDINCTMDSVYQIQTEFHINFDIMAADIYKPNWPTQDNATIFENTLRFVAFGDDKYLIVDNDKHKNGTNFRKDIFKCKSNSLIYFLIGTFALALIVVGLLIYLSFDRRTRFSTNSSGSTSDKSPAKHMGWNSYRSAVPDKNKS